MRHPVNVLQRFQKRGVLQCAMRRASGQLDRGLQVAERALGQAQSLQVAPPSHRLNEFGPVTQPFQALAGPLLFLRRQGRPGTGDPAIPGALVLPAGHDPPCRRILARVDQSLSAGVAKMVFQFDSPLRMTPLVSERNRFLWAASELLRYS